MSWRKAENPVLSALTWCVFGLALYSAGMAKGVQVQECPLALEDGRRLIGRDIRTVQPVCKYEAVGKPMASISPGEGRTRTYWQKRLDKVR